MRKHLRDNPHWENLEAPSVLSSMKERLLALVRGMEEDTKAGRSLGLRIVDWNKEVQLGELEPFPEDPDTFAIVCRKQAVPLMRHRYGTPLELLGCGNVEDAYRLFALHPHISKICDVLQWCVNRNAAEAEVLARTEPGAVAGFRFARGEMSVSFGSGFRRLPCAFRSTVRGFLLCHAKLSKSATSLGKIDAPLLMRILEWLDTTDGVDVVFRYTELLVRCDPAPLTIGRKFWVPGRLDHEYAPHLGSYEPPVSV